MSYQETSKTSWLQRTGKAFAGVLGGIVLFFGATALLYWNEGNFVKTRDVINEAGGTLISLDKVDSIDPALDHKLIHASARAETQDILHDRQFGISANAIAMKREAEYYQWVETRHEETEDKVGGGQETVITYTYNLQWVNEPVDSNIFKDPDYRGRNYILLDVTDQTIYANNVRFGAYQLPLFLMKRIDDSTPLDVELSNDMINQINNRIGNFSDGSMVNVTGNTVYLGTSQMDPRVGDVRLTFTQAVPGDVSIIAQVNKGTFEPYISEKNGYEFSRLSMGVRSASLMIADAHKDNAFLTWFIRACGIIGLIAGIILLLKPLSALAAVLPFLGKTVEFISTGIAILLGLAWGIMIIAIGWLRFRPLIGGGLLLIAIGLVLYAVLQGQKTIKADSAASAQD